jgi:hypothetical protein
MAVEKPDPAPPEPWSALRLRPRLAAPLIAIDWALEWFVYVLRRSALFDLLELAGRLGILIAAVSYLRGGEQRKRAAQFQAWQVITGAEGKGGNAGRLEALEALNADGASLSGVRLDSAALQGIALPRADLSRARMSFVLMQRADLVGADLTRADLRLADLAGADVAGASFAGALLDRANLRGLRNWRAIASLEGARITCVQEPPAGFMRWAVDSMRALVTDPRCPYE